MRSDGHFESVLVVDDEVQVVTVLEMSLRNEGYATFTAHDGLEALAQVDRHHPDLMVLDVMMPRKDGWSVLEELQALPPHERPRVIMVTALATAADRTRATSMGAAAYVSKPFDVDALLGILHGLELAS
jgi:two-component system response regulator MprA